MSIVVLRERYHEGSGPLYRADPRVKIVLAVAFAFAVTTVHEGDWRALAGFAAAAGLAVGLSRLPPLLVLRRALVALPFIAAAVPLVFTRPGETLFTVPAVGWTASAEGLTAVATIMLKSWLSVILAVVLTSCTQPIDLIRGLERLRVPRVLAATIFFMYRYLYVIGGEGQRMLRARDARSAAAPDGRRSGGTVGWRARVTGAMAGSLFLRSFERAERIHAAMQARGYDGTIRFAQERTLVRADWLLLLTALTLFGGLALYARL